MVWRDALIETWRMHERLGAKPTVRKTIQIARLMGAKFRDADAYALLANFRAAAGQREETQRAAFSEHEGSISENSGQHSGRGFTRANKVLLVTKPSTSSYLSDTQTIVPTPQAETTPIDVNATKVEKKRRSRSKPDQETEFTYAADTSVLDELPSADDECQPRWVRDMRMLWVPMVVDRPIGQLNADHRFALARYHAWRWANCRVDEAKNRHAAMRIAAGVTNLAADRRYAALTVRKFIDLGDQAWAAGGRKPMHAVWPIVGRVAVAA